MSFCNIELKNFRNIISSKLLTDAPEVFFIGKNGQGKTNLLESIYFLCYGTSFRTRNDSNLCNYDSNFLNASATYKNFDEDFNKIDIIINNGKKKIKLNDKNITDRKNIIRNIPCIIFCHNDIGFVNGSPEKRRQYIDQTLSLYNPYYIDILRKYKKILKTRNLLLKEKKTDLLKVYNQKFIEIGMEIQSKREEIISIFNPIFQNKFSTISKYTEIIDMEYQSTWKKFKNKDEINNYLDSKLDYEMNVGISTSGPHRDKLVFLHRDKDFSEVGSTGQMRLISLILRILQADYYSKTTNKKPLLLLDDVLLELDLEKRKKVLDNLPAYNQAFFTFLPNEDYVNYHKKNTIKYSVENGDFTRFE